MSHQKHLNFIIYLAQSLQNLWNLSNETLKVLLKAFEFHYYNPASTKFKGGYTGFTLSVSAASVCLCVDGIMSTHKGYFTKN